MMNSKDLKRALEVQSGMTERLVLGKLLVKLNLIGMSEVERALQIQREMMSGSHTQ
jgi:hypothetical protein